MTVEEAVRQELRDAYHQEMKLFAQFMQSLGEIKDPHHAQFWQQQLQDAARRKQELRTILFGVLEGERIRKERMGTV